jgi:hypothetical protein
MLPNYIATARSSDKLMEEEINEDIISDNSQQIS